MKKTYETPNAEIMEFDYTDTITASSGRAYQRYIDGHYACNDTPTGEWYGYVNDTTGPCWKRIS
ncbi:MAG: hypothetical protein IKQ41_05175 [Clostridia bacterium]|nr:hypothetical protein [Clostridia bacterium]